MWKYKVVSPEEVLSKSTGMAFSSVQAWRNRGLWLNISWLQKKQICRIWN